VKDVTHQTQQTVSSITTVDLRGIASILEVFTIILAAAATSLFIVLAHSERRHEFATMAALGARLRDIRSFVWSASAAGSPPAVVLAAGLGWLLSEMLIAMLQHVFAPPPDSLAIPWRYLTELLAGALAGSLLAGAAAARGLTRMQLGAILR